MGRRTLEESEDCADCGVQVDVALDQGYEGPGNWILCSSCARERGAHFDENEGCWTIPPDMSGLLAQREHRER